MPKLTTITTDEGSETFENPRHITLEGTTYHSHITNRHALSHYCYSCHSICFLQEENDSHEEFLFLLPLIPRHLSRSPILFRIYCFFYTQFNTNTHSHFAFLNLPLVSNKHFTTIIVLQIYTLQHRCTTSNPLGGKTRATNQKTPSYLQLQ